MKTYREDLKDAVLAVFYRAHDQYDPRLTEEMDRRSTTRRSCPCTWTGT